MIVELDSLPPPLTIGNTTIDASVSLARVGVSLSAADGDLVLDISRYTVAGIPLGIVRTKAAETILARLRDYPALIARKVGDGNLRVTVIGWNVVDAEVSAGIVRIQIRRVT